MSFDSRQTRRMLQRMGINLTPIEGVEEVIIRTREKDIHVRDANVSEFTAQGVRMFQVVANEVEEKAREKPKFTEEDVLLVAQQAKVSRERAIAALEQCDGESAKAIVSLLG